MATKAEILRHIVVIGMLPKSKVRIELIAAYAGHEALTSLIPAGLTVEAEPAVGDIEALTDAELVAFLKGAALILGPNLRRETHCICNMCGCVIWPVAAYAALLRRDVALARKTWKSFAKIPRLCAERLPVGPDVDLRRMDFEEFIFQIATGGVRSEGADLADFASAAAEQMGRAYRLS